MADLQAVVSDWYVLLLIAGAHHGLAQRQTMTVDNSYSMQGTVCGDEVFNEQRSKICWYLQATKKWKHTNTPPPKKKKSLKQLYLQIKSWQVFSVTDVALFMWIFYIVMSLSIVIITVMFWVMCKLVCLWKNSLVWSLMVFCLSRTMNELILLIALCACYSNLSGNCCHILLRVQISSGTLCRCRVH